MKPETMHRRLRRTSMLLLIVTLQLAVASLISGSQSIGLLEPNQQQQTMISTATPLLAEAQPTLEAASAPSGQEPTNKTQIGDLKQTSDISETSESEPDLKHADSHQSIHTLGSNELRYDPFRGPESIVVRAEAADGSEIDSSSVISRFQAHNVKSRRHANLFNPPVADWWTKLAPAKPQLVQPPPAGKSSEAKGAADRQHQSVETTPIHETGKQRRPESTTAATKHSNNGATMKSSSSFSFAAEHATSTTLKPRTTVAYKEQALNQNAILTIKNQLSAIKGKHRVLITRSMQQLQQLDNRLIESYRLCLKGKMPLYAGMLYRTRDFVARMAKEANHERKVLEAMTKQVHTVLHQKMTNRTLVREYNRLIAAPSSTSNSAEGLLDDETALQPKQQPLAKSDNLQPYLQTHTQDLVRSTSPQRASHEEIGGSASQLANSFEESTAQQAAGASNDTRRSMATKRREEFSSLWPLSRKEQLLKKEKESSQSKGKPNKYTVSVNEVNLKKELTKIQALIDRINGSTHEISSVVDDIIYLFKLSPTDNSHSRRGKPSGNRLSSTSQTTDNQAATMYAANYDPKQAKKMLRAPIKVFLEKYGKLANLRGMNDEFNGIAGGGTSNSEFTSMNLQEIKPLFEPSSLVYSELRDPDIGFE